MQVDFHYYCIAVLARAAGLAKKDALTIAYASQYVDDATESELIRLDAGQGDLRFDPVRTCYRGLESLLSLTWSAQKRIWIPFHFLPAKPFRPQASEDFSFITEPDSLFARHVLREALDEPPRNRKRRLCRIGIALHTYADSWAHRHFSGRQNRTENDVENIAVWRDDKVVHLDVENVVLDVMPQIGHAEAGLFPDLAFQKWQYDCRRSPPTVERDNTQEFLVACRRIYGWLRQVAQPEPALKQWKEIEPDVRQLLAGEPSRQAGLGERLTLPAYRSFHMWDIGERCRRWQERYAALFDLSPDTFVYDRGAWRRQALEGETEWDDFTLRDWDRRRYRKKRGFWSSLWVHFHRAALRQRHLVLESLP